MSVKVSALNARIVDLESALAVSQSINAVLTEDIKILRQEIARYESRFGGLWYVRTGN